MYIKRIQRGVYYKYFSILEINYKRMSFFLVKFTKFAIDNQNQLINNA